MERDKVDAHKIMDTLQDFTVFDLDRDNLICISTKDIVSSDVA